MSVGTVSINLRLSYPSFLLAVLFLHALFLFQQGLPELRKIVQDEPVTPLNIREIRTVGARDGRLKNFAYLQKSTSPAKAIEPRKTGVPAKSLSLADLTVPATATAAAPVPKKPVRPGTRPEAFPQRPKAINAISLKGSQMKDLIQGTSASTLSRDPRLKTLSNSDVLVNLEVPEGVNPDELNKYELMFYGFQRRTAINYVNSFYKRLDKFQLENPHLEFPMTSTKQLMTGRLTYDEKGNIKSIKMIRWSNMEKLQDFFVDVLKDMDTLHNPPEALWKDTGEFSIFFSLQLNG